uniref:Protein kinase domain-containing protein n=1 Tax=Panagrolaimus sp. ES5 TaxID=591445 RepID=A0AC34FH05_9BILA
MSLKIINSEENVVFLRKINLRKLEALETGMSASEEFDDFDIDLEVPPTVSELLPFKNNIIQGQENSYAVGRKLMPGRYGAIYEVLRKNDGRPFAAKLEVVDHGFTGLNMEYKVLKAASKANLEQIPLLIDRGKIEARFKFIVIQLLGPNLWKLRHDFVEHRFSAPTCLRLATETLNALESLHIIGFIHRDIKPSNFLISEEKGKSKIILIDFGICRPYKNANGDLKPPRDECSFRGTTRYASLSAHNEMEQSRRDDLEGWFYMVVEMFTGDLPWSTFRKPDREMVKKLKVHARSNEGSRELLNHCPRTEFRRIMNYIDTLTYYSTPDYSYLRQMINLAMKNYDIHSDEPFDWEQKNTVADEEDKDAQDPMNNNIAKHTNKQSDEIIKNLNGLL